MVTENSQSRRGRPVNEALGQTIVDTAGELFAELGFQATTLDKVAQRAKISKLSIYRHFENKEALFGAAFAARCHQLIPQVLFEGVDGSAEDQLMAVGSSCFGRCCARTFAVSKPWSRPMSQVKSR